MPIAVVTGASRGIGAALREALAHRGFDVIGTRRGPAEPGWLTLDVTDPGSHAAMASALDGAPLDLLVCNAGIFADRGQDLATGFAAPLWSEMFATNVTGVFLAVQALLPNLEAAGGKVAIISSQLGSSTRAAGGNYIYRASKAAAVNLGRNLAVDLEGRGIAVGTYHPGWVRTDMGGQGAAISPEQSAQGLCDRFDALGLDNTGRFLTWDGKEHPL